LSQLAGATSALILVIFALMNLSLILIRRKCPTTDGFKVPTVTPFVALACCVALLCFVSKESFSTAGVIAGVGALLTLARKYPPDTTGATSI